MNLNVVLSPEGINDAIKELERYKNNLRNKMLQFVDRLLANGFRIVNAEKGKALGDSDTSFMPEVRFNSVTKNTYRATLSITGRDVLFVEFGAGVHYNGSLGSSPNPKGSEFGYFIGSYPNQTHAGEDFWYYQSEDGHWERSNGTKAAMPMYKASEWIRGHFASIAREVFDTNG